MENDGFMAEKIFTDASGDGRIAWYNETKDEGWSGQSEAKTNNEAEYLAVIAALESAKEKDVDIFSDSKLVVGQLRREWHIKQDRMRELFDKVQKLIKERGLKVTYCWVAREDNPAGKYLG
jgi:ribonuclease HI